MERFHPLFGEVRLSVSTLRVLNEMWQAEIRLVRPMEGVDGPVQIVQTIGLRVGFSESDALSAAFSDADSVMHEFMRNLQNDAFAQLRASQSTD